MKIFIFFFNKIKIVNQLKKLDIVKNVFPVHDKNELKKLETIWYKSVKSYGFFEYIPIGYFSEIIIGFDF